MKKYATVLTIAGSDSSGGAGIQADIKAICANGGYAASVITVLTAQNTMGVHDIQALPPAFIDAQLEAVFSDIKIQAVKIGMLHSTEVVECIRHALERHRPLHVVLDPVMTAKGGQKLSDQTVVQHMAKRLLSLTTLITPNIPEAEILLGHAISSKKDRLSAAQTLAALYQTNVLIKGGHAEDNTCDDILFLWKNKKAIWFFADRIQTQNTHGTGCSLSATIATLLAKKHSLTSAVAQAKQYISHAILTGKNYRLGHGHGPIHHFFSQEEK